MTRNSKKTSCSGVEDTKTSEEKKTSAEKKTNKEGADSVPSASVTQKMEDYFKQKEFDYAEFCEKAKGMDGATLLRLMNITPSKNKDDKKGQKSDGETDGQKILLLKQKVLAKLTAKKILLLIQKVTLKV